MGDHKYLHIKSLEDYNPGYKDRELIWCKVYFKMIGADPEFEMLCEIDKWRYVAFVILELQIKKFVPLSEAYLVRKGFDFSSRPLSLTLNALHNSIEVHNSCNESVTQNRIEKNREEKIDVPVTKQKEAAIALIDQYNEICGGRGSLPKAQKILPSARLRSIAARQKDMQELEGWTWERFFHTVANSPFLRGENDRGWCASFTWLMNATNFEKVVNGNFACGLDKPRKYDPMKRF